MEQEKTEKTERFAYSVSSVLAVCKESAMHPLFDQASAITSDVIGAAIEVHRDKGPGLLESIYEWCLTLELQLRGHRVQRQKNVVIRYKRSLAKNRCAATC